MNKKRLIKSIVVASAVGAMTVAPLMSPNILTLGKGATVVYADTKDYVIDKTTESYEALNYEATYTNVGVTNDRAVKKGDILKLTVTLSNPNISFDRGYIINLPLIQENSAFKAKQTDSYTINNQKQSYNNKTYQTSRFSDGGYSTQPIILRKNSNEKITYVFEFEVTSEPDFTDISIPLKAEITTWQNPDTAFQNLDSDDLTLTGVAGSYGINLIKREFNMTVTYEAQTDINNTKEIAQSSTLYFGDSSLKDDGSYDFSLPIKEINGYTFIGAFLNTISSKLSDNGNTITGNNSASGSKITLKYVKNGEDIPEIPTVPDKEYGNLIVKYQDKEGTDLADSEKKSVEVDKEYTATAKNFEGYTLEGEATVTGNMTKDGQTIVFSYNKNEVTPTPEEPETPEPEVEEPEVVEPEIPEDLVDENTTTETPDENELAVQETEESISTTKLVLISILSIFLSGGIIYLLVNNDTKRLKGFKK